MEGTIVSRQIQKINQTLRSHSLIGLALLLGLGCLEYPYLRNCFLGPQKIDAKQLLQIKGIEDIDRDFITFTSPKATDTGFRQKGSKSQFDEKYALAIIGNEKVLLVLARVKENLQESTFTGRVSTIPSDTQTEVVDRLVKQRPTLQDKVLPFMLETDSYETWLYILLPVLIGGLSICIGIIYAVDFVTKNPHKHPVYVSLTTYGDGDSVANDIDREITDTYNIQELKIDTLYLTPQWLVFPGKYSLKIIKLDRLMWMTKQVIKDRDGGRNYWIFLHGSSGQVLSIKLDLENQINRTIEKISEYAPWAIVGSSPELKKMWKEQRNNFYLMVEQRKQEFKK